MNPPGTIAPSEMVASTLRFSRSRLVLVAACLLSTLYFVNVMFSSTSGLTMIQRRHKCQLPVEDRYTNLRNSTEPHALLGDHLADDDDGAMASIPKHDPRERLLDVDTVAPATVFFVWCAGRHRTFDFRHYLSVRSAYFAFRPDSIWFYYTLEPLVDRWTYGTWLNELADEFPFFARRPVYDLGHLDACVGEQPSEDFVAWLVSSRGGLYVDIETVVADFSSELRSLDAFVAYDPISPLAASGVGSPASKNQRRRARMMMSKPGRLCAGASKKDAVAKGRVGVASCVAATSLDSVGQHNRSSAVCVVTPETLYPRDLWSGGNGGRTARRYLVRAMYGTDELPKPVASFDDLAPNIGHVIWIGGGKMKFAFFLSVLSLLNCAGVDDVYVHGDRKPWGFFWKLLLKSQAGRVKFVQREDIGVVYGQSVDFRSHVSDVWRADILYKYGGVYLDTDAVFVRPLSQEIRAYDSVAAYDWPEWHSPFPDIFNLGVTLGKPGARFWRLFQKSMKDFRDFDFSWNGLRQPYRIYERHPDLLFVEPRLQVICFQFRCHPTWWPGYHDPAVDHLHPPVGAAPLNWRTDAYAFHFTNPTPSEYHKPETLLSSTGMFAEIGQHILNQSKLTDYFRSTYKPEFDV